MFFHLTPYRYNKEVAEIHETNHNMSAAIDYYQRAVDNHEQDGKRQAANSCLLKIATICTLSVSPAINAFLIYFLIVTLILLLLFLLISLPFISSNLISSQNNEYGRGAGIFEESGKKKE